MFTAILYGVAGTGLILSFFKDRKKTKMALKKAWKSFENMTMTPISRKLSVRESLKWLLSAFTTLVAARWLKRLAKNWPAMYLKATPLVRS